VAERTADGSARDVSARSAVIASRWRAIMRAGTWFRRRGAAPTLISSVGHVKSLDQSVGIPVTPRSPTHAPITPLPAPAKQICPNEGSPPFSLGSCSLMKSEYEEKTTPLICLGMSASVAVLASVSGSNRKAALTKAIPAYISSSALRPLCAIMVTTHHRGQYTLEQPMHLLLAHNRTCTSQYCLRSLNPTHDPPNAPKVLAYLPANSGVWYRTLTTSKGWPTTSPAAPAQS
jgi:hypothetical protein